MKEFTEKQKKIYSEIEKIIWEDWNPIGLNKNESNDEYESYLNQLFSMKINGANETKIKEYLIKVEFEVMEIVVEENIEKMIQKIMSI